METLKKLRTLLSINKVLLELKSLNSFSSTDYTVFEMTKEYFLDIFEIRLEINNDMGIVIDGLAQTVENIEKGKDKIIISHPTGARLSTTLALAYSECLLKLKDKS